MRTGVLSLRTLSEALKGVAADPFLKGAALLYSEVACWAGKDAVEGLVERLGQGMSRKQRKAVRSCFMSTTKLDPKLSVLGSVEVIERLAKWTQSTDTIDPEMFGQMVEDFVVEQKQNPQHEVISLYLSMHFGCPFHAHPVETKILARLFVKRPVVVPSDQAPLTVSLPDLELLSWSDIAELRESPYLDKYRVFLSSFYLRADADKQIAEEINEALWEAVGSLKPSKSGSALKRLIGQVPLPFSIPNPYSVYQDIKGGAKEAKLFREYGWLWFVQEARERAEPQQGV